MSSHKQETKDNSIIIMNAKDYIDNANKIYQNLNEYKKENTGKELDYWTIHHTKDTALQRYSSCLRDCISYINRDMKLGETRTFCHFDTNTNAVKASGELIEQLKEKNFKVFIDKAKNHIGIIRIRYYPNDSFWSKWLS